MTADRTWWQLAHAHNGALIQRYVEVNELIANNAMVALCLTAREFREDVKYVLLDDSDQGDWQTALGLLTALPQVAGDYSDGSVDADPDDEFDDEGWASSLHDDATGTWAPFTVQSELLPGYRMLDVDKVLAEVSLPWRPASEQGRVLVAQGRCGQPTNWPDRPCGLSGGHPGMHYPDLSALGARTGDTADCGGCAGVIEFDGTTWWHTRIDDGSHVASPAAS